MSTRTPHDVRAPTSLDQKMCATPFGEAVWVLAGPLIQAAQDCLGPWQRHWNRNKTREAGMMLSMTNANMREQLPVFIPSPMFAALRKRVLPEGTRNESFQCPATGDCPALVRSFLFAPPCSPCFPVLLSSTRLQDLDRHAPPAPPSTHGRPWLVGNFWACTSTGSWREYPGTSCNWICSARPDLPCALGGHPTHPPSTKAPHNSRAYNYTPQSAPHHRLPPFLRPASAQQPPSTKVHQTRATLPLSTAKADLEPSTLPRSDDDDFAHRRKLPVLDAAPKERREPGRTPID